MLVHGIGLEGYGLGPLEQIQERWSMESWLYMLWAELEWRSGNHNPLEELLG